MARVVLVGNLAQLTGGVAEFQLPATSVRQLFQQLTELPMSPPKILKALQAKGLNKPSTNGKRGKGTNGGPPKH